MALAVLSVAGRLPDRAPWAWWAAAVGLFALVSTGVGAPRTYDERAWSGPGWLAAHVLYAAIAACVCSRRSPAATSAGRAGSCACACSRGSG